MNPLVYLGHPGHELRIFGWLRHTRPVMWAITDGSGSAAESRVHLSHQVLSAAGINLSPRFGQLPDKTFYAHILSGDPTFFLEQIDALAAALVAGQHDLLVSDAIEGYSTTHDLCHVIAASAARLASFRSGRAIPHHHFPLVGDPHGTPDQRTASDLVHELDPASVQLKIDVALDYGRRASPALLKEVEETVARFGPAAFARERLFASPPVPYRTRFTDKPYYESHGEQRAREGCYESIIRYLEHMSPLADTLEAHASRP